MREDTDKIESAKSATQTAIKLDRKDMQILAAKASNPDSSQQDIADATGIPRSTVGDRLRKFSESEVVQQAREGLCRLLPAALNVYTEVVEPSKDKFGIAKPVDPNLRVTVATNILRGTGAHVEKKREERSDVPATAEGLFDAIGRLSTYELRRFNALCRGDDPDAEAPDTLVDGTEPSQDASGNGVELQAQPVPDGNL